MKKVKTLVLGVVAVLGLSGQAAMGQGKSEPVRIAFDLPARPPGTGILLQSYYEAGFIFTSIAESGRFGRIAPGDPRDPDFVTPFLNTGFSLTSGGLFDLVSVDLAEYSTVVPDAVPVSFVGYYSDGTTVTTSFLTDGIIDGPAGARDFETFHFGPEFSGLTRVEIPTYGWSLDNVVVVIPEPSTGTLLVFGAILLGLRRYRRTRTLGYKLPRQSLPGQSETEESPDR